MKNRSYMEFIYSRRNLMVFLFLFGLTLTCSAQKKPYYNEQEQAIEAAYKALDTEMSSGDLIAWAKENQINGSYTFDLTIGGKKGEVYTVFAVEREGEVNHQNRLKSYLKSMRFPFKMPKDKSYKFRYEFKF